MKELTFRERATIAILFFIIKILNPTGYTHQIDALQREFEEAQNGKAVQAKG